MPNTFKHDKKKTFFFLQSFVHSFPLSCHLAIERLSFGILLLADDTKTPYKINQQKSNFFFLWKFSKFATISGLVVLLSVSKRVISVWDIKFLRADKKRKEWNFRSRRKRKRKKKVFPFFQRKKLFAKIILWRIITCWKIQTPTFLRGLRSSLKYGLHPMPMPIYGKYRGKFFFIHFNNSSDSLRKCVYVQIPIDQEEISIFFFFGSFSPLSTHPPRGCVSGLFSFCVCSVCILENLI